MNLIKIMVSTIFISLFAIAIITFASNFGYDNDTSINIANDPDISEINTGMQSELDSFYVNANTSAEAFSQSTISSQTESTEGGTQFKVLTNNPLTIARRGIEGGFEKIFGSSSAFGVVLTTFVGVLGAIVLLLAYKAWAGRDPG